MILRGKMQSVGAGYVTSYNFNHFPYGRSSPLEDNVDTIYTLN
jgi:hypothetical protein